MKFSSGSRFIYAPATLFFIFLSLVSCRKDDFPDPGSLPKGLAGSWVETTTKADTIIFSSERETGIFFLDRGSEFRDGYWLPKPGCTAYSYEIAGDSISVTDLLSSSMEGGMYYYRYDESRLTITIGKFSAYINTNKPNLTFRKIK